MDKKIKGEKTVEIVARKKYIKGKIVEVEISIYENGILVKRVKTNDGGNTTEQLNWTYKNKNLVKWEKHKNGILFAQEIWIYKNKNLIEKLLWNKDINIIEWGKYKKGSMIKHRLLKYTSKNLRNILVK